MNKPRERTYTLAVSQPTAGYRINFWQHEVSVCLERAARSIVEAGQKLEKAVQEFQQVGDGHWKHAYSALLDELNMSQPTAHWLRKIGTHKALADPNNWKRLPAAWTTLRELTRVPPEEVQQHIDAGRITPTLSGKDAHAIRVDGVSMLGNHSKWNGSADEEPQRKHIDKDALYLWGRLCDLEKKLLSKRPLAELLKEMTPPMRQDAERILPEFKAWLSPTQQVDEGNLSMSAFLKLDKDAVIAEMITIINDHEQAELNDLFEVLKREMFQ